MLPGRSCRMRCLPGPGIRDSRPCGLVNWGIWNTVWMCWGRRNLWIRPISWNPKRYGVIVGYGNRRGLLLPDLDGVDTVEQQIDIARKKGGIRETDPYTLQRFKVVRHL
ncbi:MAG: AMMECR1 domain-containing protein [Dysosmobacter sp.]